MNSVRNPRQLRPYDGLRFGTPLSVHAPHSAIALLAIALAGCGSPLASRETFDWAGQPVSVRLPARGWTRSAFLEGGLRGIWLVKDGSVGEAILISEHGLVGESDQRPVIRDLIERLPRLEDREVTRALTLARWRTGDPLSADEATSAEDGNEALERAAAAHLAGNHDEVAVQLEIAQKVAERTHVLLRDVLDRVEFHVENRAEPDRYRITDRRGRSVSGEPAIVVDYTVETPDGARAAREVYFAHDNHLFVARFIGLDANLRLFDDVIGSITFQKRAARKPGAAS